MKLFCAVALALVVICAADTYTSDADRDLAIEVENKQDVQKILECLTSKSDCTAQDAALKRDFSDALSNACSKCTTQQKILTESFFTAVEKHFPAEYEGLQKKFDPDNKLFPALYAAVADRM